MNQVGWSNLVMGAMVLSSSVALASGRFFTDPNQTLHVQTPATIYGNRGQETVLIEQPVSVTLDGNVEKLQLPMPLGGYTFSVLGSTIELTGDDGSQVTLLGLNQPLSVTFEDQTLEMVLHGLNEATLGSKTIPKTPGRLDESGSEPASLPSFAFQPDDGIRLACAAVPRIGYDEASQAYYLYHANFLNSNSGTKFATSEDGLTFGEVQEAPSQPIDNGEEMPPIALSRTGFSQRVKLPVPTSSPECSTVNYRIFASNGTLGNGMGDGIVSLCSEDGTWFLQEAGIKMNSPDGGNVGVATAFPLNGRIHLFTMDGKSPNAAQEYRHRVWHYQSSDGTGNAFELVSDDPLGDGPTVNSGDRQNDPLAVAMPDGNYVILTMKQHRGSISPPTVRTGEIYGWYLTEDNPGTVVALPPQGETGTGVPLITVDDFVSAGHSVYSINDPSMYRMADGSYRMYVGALLKVSDYPENTTLAQCAASYPSDETEQYAWAILSATSVAQ